MQICIVYIIILLESYIILIYIYWFMVLWPILRVNINYLEHLLLLKKKILKNLSIHFNRNGLLFTYFLNIFILLTGKYVWFYFYTFIFYSLYLTLFNTHNIYTKNIQTICGVYVLLIFIKANRKQITLRFLFYDLM